MIHLIVGPIQGLVKISLIALVTLLHVLFVPILGAILVSSFDIQKKTQPFVLTCNTIRRQSHH